MSRALLGAGFSILIGVATAGVLFGPVMTGECVTIGEACDGDLICILRQFISIMPTRPDRVAAWWLLVSFYVPVAMLILTTVHPLVGAVLLQLGQFLGISVVFPLFFIPIAAFTGSAPPRRGPSALLATTAFVASFMLVMLTGGETWAADLYNNYTVVPATIFAWVILSLFGGTEWSTKSSLLISSGLGIFPWILSLAGFYHDGVDFCDCLVNLFVIDSVVLYFSLILHLWIKVSDSPVRTGLLALIVSPAVAFSLAHAKIRVPGTDRGKNKSKEN